jgi:hypothetical protein
MTILKWPFWSLNDKIKCTDNFWSLKNENEKEIRQHYKIIDVDYLNPILVKSKMFGDNYFQNLSKVQTINNMLDYYLNHEDKAIYKKTDYLCNEKEKICICNTSAEEFRKIYDGINYKKNDRYISWFIDKDKNYYD